jgi:HD-GYP domain-containing protein (c-di-GMP phosphodiesterase class II)
VSATARSRVRRDALLAALEAFLIVAITTAVLYPVVLTLIRRLARYSESLLDSNLETLALLGGAIAKKDSDTDAHNYRVTLYAVRLAEAVGLPDDEIKKLIKGGFLHDVGKIGIADAVLLKPGRLDEEEFRIMKTHVDHGLDIVDRSRWLKDAKEVVGGHHEKFDGTGYPQGLAGEAIPVGARVFAIADVFDALTSRRPYKTPFPFEETMRILDEGRGRHFDPKILDRFALIAGELHAEYCGREDDGLREALNAVVKRYFNDGTETLA